MPSHSAMARRIGKAKRSPEWPAQKIGSAVERKEPEINQSASPRNEDVGVLKARRIHEMQISRPPNPRMTHEHRPFRRSLGSNPINREKIAAAMLRHFLHWSVSLCETRWLLHLHAQPPLRPRHHITANVGSVSAQPGRFGETTASRSEAFPSLDVLQQSPIRRIRLYRSPLKANTSSQCHGKSRGQLSRDKMRAAKGGRDGTSPNR